MNEFNCAKCKKSTLFTIDERNKYHCTECNTVFYQCKNKNCVKSLYYKKCAIARRRA